jgi:hypothetical protein
LSFLICSSLSAPSSFGRDRSAFSAAARKRSCQFFDLGHSQAMLARRLRYRRLTPDDAQHQSHAALAVHRWTSSGTSAIAIHPSMVFRPWSSG